MSEENRKTRCNGNSEQGRWKDVENNRNIIPYKMKIITHYEISYPKYHFVAWSMNLMHKISISYQKYEISCMKYQLSYHKYDTSSHDMKIDIMIWNIILE